MEFEFALLADRISQSPEGKLDIIGAGFDTIFAPAVPATHPRLAVTLRLRLSREEISNEHRVEIVVRDPDGGEVARAEITAPAMPEDQRAQLADAVGVGFVVNFDRVVLPAYGEYEVGILWDGRTVREPLRVSVAKPGSGPPQ